MAQHFRHCSLLGSVFTECRLRPVTMVEVDFTLAVLGGCDLRDVDLSDCRLREASLVGADLRKAVLRRADLRGARTQDARLDEADLRGARVDPTFWTTATVRGADRLSTQALAFAAAQRAGTVARRVSAVATPAATAIPSAGLESDLPAHEARVADAEHGEHGHVEQPRARRVPPVRVMRSHGPGTSLESPTVDAVRRSPTGQA